MCREEGEDFGFDTACAIQLTCISHVKLRRNAKDFVRASSFEQEAVFSGLCAERQCRPSEGKQMQNIMQLNMTLALDAPPLHCLD
jgi:hypothetical protein